MSLGLTVTIEMARKGLETSNDRKGRPLMLTIIFFLNYTPIAVLKTMGTQ